MNYFAPKPAPRGVGFGPGYGERQPGWGGGVDPTLVNPVRPGPTVSAPAWPAEVAPQPPGAWGEGRPSDWAWSGPRRPNLYDRAHLAANLPPAGWGFGPRQLGWGGQEAGWSGFGRLVR